MISLRTVDNISAQARQLDFRGLVLIGLVGFGPLMAQFFYNLWQFDTYQFFPLAIAAGNAGASTSVPRRWPISWW